MTEKLLPIGEFARETGLTASALRFYDDTGVLIPADIDPFTGYRFYSPSQVEAGILIQRLRDTRMPLAGIHDVLAASPQDAAAMVRRHIGALGESTETAINAAEVAITQLCGESVDAPQSERSAKPQKAHRSRGTVDAMGTADPMDAVGAVVHCAAGPVVASAVDAVLPTTVLDPDLPILGTVLIELSPERIRFTATDRYRLTTRTVTSTGATRGGGDADWAGNGDPVDSNTSYDEAHDAVDDEAQNMGGGGGSWSGPVSAQRLQELLSQMRRTGTVGFSGRDGILWVEMRDGVEAVTAVDAPNGAGTVVEIPVESGDFPDYRLMLDSLPEPTTQVIADSAELLRAVEDAGDRIRIVVEPGGVMVGEAAVPARVSGAPTQVEFLLTTLYPALAGGVGPDVVLDFRGAEQPLSIRSAVRDNLTSVLMPVVHNGAAESVRS